MAESSYIPLKDLEVYKLSRELSSLGWEIYDRLSWNDKNVMGNQFIQSLDSVGANIAEGYRRFHYLDKIKFYYNSRASLSESCSHWLELLYERQKLEKDSFDKLRNLSEKLSVKLSNFIAATYKSKERETEK